MNFLCKIFLYVTLIFLLFSCGSYKENFLEYRAEFDPQKVDKAEKVVMEFAKRNKLRIFSKDRKEMSIVSNGENAFYIALYHDGDPLLSVTNVGGIVQISVSSTDYENMSKSELAGLTIALVGDLQRELNLKFKEQQNNN